MPSWTQVWNEEAKCAVDDGKNARRGRRETVIMMLGWRWRDAVDRRRVVSRLSTTMHTPRRARFLSSHFDDDDPPSKLATLTQAPSEKA